MKRGTESWEIGAPEGGEVEGAFEGEEGVKREDWLGGSGLVGARGETGPSPSSESLAEAWESALGERIAMKCMLLMTWEHAGGPESSGELGLSPSFASLFEGRLFSGNLGITRRRCSLLTSSRMRR